MESTLTVSELAAASNVVFGDSTAIPIRPEHQATVSIVMPCLNEAATVGICVTKARQWLARSGRSGEVIVVDNGSTDGSVDVATAAGARVIAESRRGYGSAYLRGFAEARGDYIVMGDSDDTYDFSDLSGLVDPLANGADLVLGNRFAGGIRAGAMPWTHRYIGSPIINRLIRVFFRVHIGDSQSGLRAFRTTVVGRLRLRSTGMELASEMIVRAAREGLRIAEVPAPYNVRVGESKLNTVRDGWRHLRFLLLAAPDFLFTLPGVVIGGVGASIQFASLAAPSGMEIGTLTWHPVFAGPVLTAVGASSALFGVIAKLYAAAHGLIREDRWVRFYRRSFHLEQVLLLGTLLFAAGLLLNVVLFTIWASGTDLGIQLQLAGVAQTFLIVGVQLGLTGFMVVIVDPPDGRPVPDVEERAKTDGA